MDAKTNVYLLRGPVVCIETGEDKPKRIYLSQVQRGPSPAEKIAERAAKIEAAVNVVSALVSAGAVVAMVTLVLHMVGIF